MAQAIESFPVLQDGSARQATASQAAAAVSPHAERARVTRHAQLLVRRSATTLGMAALWGLAAGSANPMLAVANVYKVPMVIALSVAVTMPAVLATRRLLRLAVPPVELLTAVIASLERAALVLLGFAPLLAVYAYTSQWVAPVLAQASGGLSLVAGAVALRAELRELEVSGAITSRQVTELRVLGVVTAVVLSLSLLQLISLATPVLPIHTSFGVGIDGLFHR
jgi:hypothetical protein